MSKKIKSIKFKQIKIIETEPNAKISDHGKFFAVQKEGSEIPDYWVGKEYVDGIEYEPELLKRADGSIIDGLEEGTKIIQIWQDDNIFKLNLTGKGEIAINPYNADLLKTELYNGLIFLPEDKDLAEKKAKQLSKKLEIQFEIDRLNAEQGWVADWDDFKQAKYFFRQLLGSKKITVDSSDVSSGALRYMSEKTAKTILAKYSQEELK